MSEKKSSEKSAQTPTATIAVSGCHPAETAVKNTVQTHVKPLPTMPAKSKPDLTLTSTKRQFTVKSCEHCGIEYTCKRPLQSRFCSGRCRRRQWLLDNPDRAAELAASDRERLRGHLESRGIAWVDREYR
jgi:hypothetical protein